MRLKRTSCFPNVKLFGTFCVVNNSGGIIKPLKCYSSGTIDGTGLAPDRCLATTGPALFNTHIVYNKRYDTLLHVLLCVEFDVL